MSPEGRALRVLLPAAAVVVVVSALAQVLGFVTASGGRIGFAEVEGLWVAAGGPPADAATAAAIAEAESGLRPGAIQQGDDYCGRGRDRTGWGLWQITCGDSEPQFGEDFDLLDPWNNAEAAVAKYRQAGDSFAPWSTYVDRAYVSHLPARASPPAVACDPGEYLPIGSAPPGTHNRSEPGATHGSLQVICIASHP